MGRHRVLFLLFLHGQLFQFTAGGTKQGPPRFVRCARYRTPKHGPNAIQIVPRRNDTGATIRSHPYRRYGRINFGSHPTPSLCRLFPNEYLLWQRRILTITAVVVVGVAVVVALIYSRRAVISEERGIGFGGRTIVHPLHVGEQQQGFRSKVSGTECGE